MKPVNKLRQLAEKKVFQSRVYSAKELQAVNEQRAKDALMIEDLQGQVEAWKKLALHWQGKATRH
jgi:hypothetical protein